MRLARRVSQTIEGYVKIRSGRPSGRSPGCCVLPQKRNHIVDFSCAELRRGHQRMIVRAHVFEILLEKHVQLLLEVHNLEREGILVLASSTGCRRAARLPLDGLES